MRLCRGWMTCSRARRNEDWGTGCSHATLHEGSNICFRPCDNGEHTICMELEEGLNENLWDVADMQTTV
jgi:hypothetical protein